MREQALCVICELQKVRGEAHIINAELKSQANKSSIRACLIEKIILLRRIVEFLKCKDQRCEKCRELCVYIIHT